MFPLKDSVQISCIPFITGLLVLANIICFLLELSIPPTQLEPYIKAYALVPSVFIAHFGWEQASTIFSSMFLHGGWAHLAGNMWFLHIFGDGVEDRVGHFRYFLLYFACGILAAVIQVAFDPHSTMPMIGASGAIAGVLGAYFVFFPRATVSTFLFAGFLSRVAEVPAGVYLGLWFVLQFFSGVFSHAGAAHEGAEQIAFWAHAGGFVAGIIGARAISDSELRLAKDSSDDWFTDDGGFTR